MAAADTLPVSRAKKQVQAAASATNPAGVGFAHSLTAGEWFCEISFFHFPPFDFDKKKRPVQPFPVATGVLFAILFYNHGMHRPTTGCVIRINPNRKIMPELAIIRFFTTRLERVIPEPPKLYPKLIEPSL
jgi:hypothetical protein